MKSELRQYLTQAFQHLNRFSVPGIGTFRRERVAARVDNFNKIVHPPGENFLLEPGEHYVSYFTDYFFHSMRMNHGAAEALTREIGQGVRSEVEAQGFYEIAGVGRLSKDRLYGYQLAPVNLDSPALFGLSAVPYSSLGAAAKAAETLSGGEKEKVIANRLDENTTVVEPIAPHRRRRRVWPWVAVILLVGIGLSAWFFWPQIHTQLIAMGVVDKTPLITDTTQPEKVEAGEDPVTSMVLPPDSADNKEPLPGKNDHASTEVKTPGQEPGKEPVNPPVAKTPVKQPDMSPVISGAPDISVPSVAGTFYLIVASSHEMYDAASIAQSLSASKYKVKVLKPAGDGWYRVSVYSATDKMQVIQKMVEWKNDFPDKSWIFSR